MHPGKKMTATQRQNIVDLVLYCQVRHMYRCLFLPVELGSIISGNFAQEICVSQGSILLVTQFSLKINSLDDVLKNDLQGNLKFI